MERIRIGNLEYNPEKNEDIVLWFKNEYYGNEKNLLKEGYTKDDEGNFKKGCVTIHSSCFEHEFNCYVVATIIWNKHHDEFDVKSCGTRIFDLEDNDYKNFKKIIKFIEEKNNEINENN